jgi:hypothetical protein
VVVIVEAVLIGVAPILVVVVSSVMVVVVVTVLVERRWR